MANTSYKRIQASSDLSLSVVELSEFRLIYQCIKQLIIIPVLSYSTFQLNTFSDLDVFTFGSCDTMQLGYQV